MLTREEFEQIATRLARLPFASELVLVGSSILYRLSDVVPPLTEDADVVLPEKLILEHESDVRAALAAAGFRQVEGTATWLDQAGLSLDLLATSTEPTSDRSGGTPTMPAMVFSDLCRLLAHPAGRDRSSDSEHGLGSHAEPCHLSAAALILSKLLAVRLEKGPKDRLHALLLLAQSQNLDALAADFRALAGQFPPDALEDILPEAQAAAIALSQAALPGLQPYREYLPLVQMGLRLLTRILEGL